MLSSIAIPVRMLDGRDRGCVLEVNREIALDLIASKQALAIDDVTAKGALEDWSHEQLADFLKANPVRGERGIEHDSIPTEVQPPTPSAEVSIPRAKAKRR